MNSTKKTKDQLEQQGIIFLWGTITDDIAQAVCQKIIEANFNPRLEHIQLLINSGGGSCQAGFAIIDMMEWSQIPIYTAGFSLVGSMASLIFSAGTRGHRTITPATVLLSHHYRSMNIGSYPDLISMRKYEDFLYGRVVNHFLKYSSLTTEKDVLAHILRDVDTWLTPDEAIELGLADLVSSDTATTHHAERLR